MGIRKFRAHLLLRGKEGQSKGSKGQDQTSKKKGCSKSVEKQEKHRHAEWWFFGVGVHLPVRRRILSKLANLAPYPAEETSLSWPAKSSNQPIVDPVACCTGNTGNAWTNKKPPETGCVHHYGHLFAGQSHQSHESHESLESHCQVKNGEGHGEQEHQGWTALRTVGNSWLFQYQRAGWATNCIGFGQMARNQQFRAGGLRKCILSKVNAKRKTAKDSFWELKFANSPSFNVGCVSSTNSQAWSIDLRPKKFAETIVAIRYFETKKDGLIAAIPTYGSGFWPFPYLCSFKSYFVTYMCGQFSSHMCWGWLVRPAEAGLDSTFWNIN